jgi:hypothetical protein
VDKGNPTLILKEMNFCWPKKPLDKKKSKIKKVEVTDIE